MEREKRHEKENSWTQRGGVGGAARRLSGAATDRPPVVGRPPTTSDVDFSSVPYRVPLLFVFGFDSFFLASTAFVWIIRQCSQSTGGCGLLRLWLDRDQGRSSGCWRSWIAQIQRVERAGRSRLLFAACTDRRRLDFSIGRVVSGQGRWMRFHWIGFSGPAARVSGAILASRVCFAFSFGAVGANLPRHWSIWIQSIVGARREWIQWCCIDCLIVDRRRNGLSITRLRTDAQTHAPTPRWVAPTCCWRLSARVYRVLFTAFSLGRPARWSLLLDCRL